MENSKYKYYTEMCNTLTGYNNKNNMPSSNANIWEVMRKVMVEESTTYANIITADKFSHVSNTQRENENTIFTSENL